MDNAFQLSDVSLSKNGQKILDNINLNVRKGSIYGFLGPNGAGKTTVMKILLNLFHTEEGIVEVLGSEVTSKSYDYLKSIGSIIETPVFYDRLTVEKNLEIHCDYMGIYDSKRIEKKLELVGLLKVKKKKVKELSLGMKQRLAIARALITEPELLILDEPINGLDPFGIKEIREVLIQINRELGTTIFISSHIISEMESLCDVIGFIKDGKLIKEITLEDIEHESKKYIEITVDDTTKASTIIDARLATNQFKVMNDQTIRIYDSTITQKEIMEQFILNDVIITKIIEQTNDLEDYFVKLMSGGSKK